MNHYFEFIIVVFVGIATLVLSYYLYRKSKETLNWIEAKGKIENIYIDKLEFVQEARKAYRSRVLYSYTYQDKTYKSKRLFYGDFIRKTWPGRTKALIDMYRSDNIIIVYINPLNPQESVIQKGVPIIVNYLFIVGLFFIIIGVLIALIT